MGDPITDTVCLTAGIQKNTFGLCSEDSGGREPLRVHRWSLKVEGMTLKSNLQLQMDNPVAWDRSSPVKLNMELQCK